MYLIEIPFKHTDKLNKVALRVFDKKKQIHYASTGIETLKKTTTGFSFEFGENLTGKQFELKSIDSRKVIAKGNIEKVTKLEVETKKDKGNGEKKV